MKVLVVFASCMALAFGGVIVPELGSTLVRAPAHDSASIESHRFGGNFAYATAEAHAFAKVTPKFATVRQPVAETVHIHQPAAIKTIQPAPIITTKHVPQPILQEEPVLVQQPVIGPVATEVTYKQPIIKTQTYAHDAYAPSFGFQGYPVAAPVFPLVAPAYGQGPALVPVPVGRHH